MNPALYNAVFRVSRKVAVGSDYGTPITETVNHDVPGWFDEALQSMRASRSDRGTTIPTSMRKAIFGCGAEADLLTRDEGRVIVNGVDHGRWTVEKDELVPIPSGISHREVTLQRIEESR